MTGLDFGTFEVAPVRDGGQILRPHLTACQLGHRRQLLSVRADVGHNVRDDQVVFGIYCSLDVRRMSS